MSGQVKLNDWAFEIETDRCVECKKPFAVGECRLRVMPGIITAVDAKVLTMRHPLSSGVWCNERCLVNWLTRQLQPS